MVVIVHFLYRNSYSVNDNRSFEIMNNHKRSSTILLALFFCVMLSNALFAQAPGEFKLEQLILVDAQPFMTQERLSHGYYVFRCKIQNQDVKPHKVKLSCYNIASKSFDLQSGETITASLPMPVTNSNFGNSVQVSADNKNLYTISCPMRRAITSYPSHHYRSRYVSYVPHDEDSISHAVLICRSLRKRFAEVDCIFAEKDCKYWPQDRMDYSCLDFIFLTPAELVVAPEGVQTALKQFVLSGGILWFFECDTQKEAFDQIEWVAQLIKETQPNEFGRSQNQNVTRQYQAGFGVIVVTKDNASFEQLENQSIADKEMFNIFYKSFDSKPSWYEINPINDLQKWFPVVSDLSIPLLGISIVILLFVLLAGPINLFLLTAYNKRILLLVTVPALSFLFAGAILLYVILADGFNTDARIASTAYLDQRSGMYSALSQYGIYARTTPRNVVFDSDDELNISDNSDDERLSIDWTSGKQVVSSRFATVRKPAYYKIRKAGTTRLKLDFDFNEDNPYVVNGLGKDVNKLFVCDAKGSLWKAENIAAGQKAKLSPVDKLDDKNQNKEDILHYCILTSRWDSNEFSINMQKRANALRPGSYFATFSSSGPFASKGISYAKEKNSFAFMVGRFE